MTEKDNWVFTIMNLCLQNYPMHNIVKKEPQWNSR